MTFNNLANNESLKKTSEALTEKGYQVFIVDKPTEALEKIKTLIPNGASVINGASVSLEKIGYMDYLKSGKSGWVNLLDEVTKENDPIKRSVLRRHASVSDFYLGSVHALTQDGNMIIASNTGSQLTSVVYNSTNLIFVVGTQKIVPNLSEGIKRLEEYIFPLETEHMKTLYGVGTNISKLLIFKAESPMTGRKINIILIKEELGF